MLSSGAVSIGHDLHGREALDLLWQLIRDPANDDLVMSRVS